MLSTTSNCDFMYDSSSGFDALRDVKYEQLARFKKKKKEVIILHTVITMSSSIKMCDIIYVYEKPIPK